MKFPDKDTALQATYKSDEVMNFLANRRSTVVKLMSEPGPSAEQLDVILRIAARVPDHRKLSPWRFIVFEGQTRADFGAHLAEKFAQDCGNVDAARVQFERDRFMRAPLVVAVVSSPVDCPRGTPKWEQELSAGAVCMNMLLAVRASGFAAQWLSEWYAFDAHIATVLGLSEGERMAGFIYMGTCDGPLSERPRPEIGPLVSRWEAL